MIEKNYLDCGRLQIIIFMGHSVGGTNPTLIEAISLRLPVIAYDCSFNKKIIGKNGSFFKTPMIYLNLLKVRILLIRT